MIQQPHTVILLAMFVIRTLYMNVNAIVVGARLEATERSVGEDEFGELVILIGQLNLCNIWYAFIRQVKTYVV